MPPAKAVPVSSTLDLYDWFDRRVEVYWNYHRTCWSVRRPSGRVIGYTQDDLELYDVRWRVQWSAHRRIQETRQRHVAAWVQGKLRNIGVAPGTGLCNARYDPFGHARWFLANGTTITETPCAFLTIQDSKPYAWTTSVVSQKTQLSLFAPTDGEGVTAPTNTSTVGRSSERGSTDPTTHTSSTTRKATST